MRSARNRTVSSSITAAAGSCWISHDVRYLSSSMPGQLARLARDVASARGQLKITGLGPVLRDTFRIGRFEPLFAIYDDKASALKAFR